MKAFIRSIELKQFEVKNGENRGKKFKKFVFICDVVIDVEKGIVKTLQGSMGEEYGRKYFKYCGYKYLSEIIGKICEVTTQKRMWVDSNGNERISNEISYLRMLDTDGNKITLPCNDETEL